MAISLVAQATFDHVATLNDTITYTSSGGGPGSLMVLLSTRAGGTATGAISSVTDSAGNIWTRKTRGSVSGVNNTRIECWVTWGYSSITSITVNSSALLYYASSLTEWSGLVAGFNPADGASPDNSGNVSSTAQATPPISTMYSADLVISAIHYAQTTGTFNNAGATPGSNWTQLTNFDSTTVGSGRAAYQVMNATGSYNGAWTLGAAQGTGTLTVAFTADSPNSFNSSPSLFWPSDDVTGGIAPWAGDPETAHNTVVYPSAASISVRVPTPRLMTLLALMSESGQGATVSVRTMSSDSPDPLPALFAPDDITGGMQPWGGAPDSIAASPNVSVTAGVASVSITAQAPAAAISSLPGQAALTI